VRSYDERADDIVPVRRIPPECVSGNTVMTESAAILLASLPLLLAAGGIWMADTWGASAFAAPLSTPRPALPAPDRVARIRFVRGPLAGVEVPVTGGIVLGRDPLKAQLIFPADETMVSRSHCSIDFDRQASMFEICDLGSSCGTFIAAGDDVPLRLAVNVVAHVDPGREILIGSPANRLVLEFA
jgi:hypothetical protein